MIAKMCHLISLLYSNCSCFACNYGHATNKFPARPSLNRSKTFIWLPFAGGISAFAVILPKPMGTGYGVGGGYPDASHVNGCYAETLDRKTGSIFGSL
jgi:hypothetical protein